jgi:hypothetical protein
MAEFRWRYGVALCIGGGRIRADAKPVDISSEESRFTRVNAEFER